MRSPEDREERRTKDLAAMARAGFSHRIARQVLELEDVEALEAVVRGEEID